MKFNGACKIEDRGRTSLESEVRLCKGSRDTKTKSEMRGDGLERFRKLQIPVKEEDGLQSIEL